MFPPTLVVYGNTKRATDLPEAILLQMEGDIDLIVVLVDFIEKRLHARKHSSVDVTSRIPGLPSEKAVRLFAEFSATINESRAQLRELQNTIVESLEKADPRAQHV